MLDKSQCRDVLFYIDLMFPNDTINWLLNWYYYYQSQNYSFLPNSLVSMLTYFSLSSTVKGYIPISSYTKLFLVYLRPNNQVVFSHNAQETWVSVLRENEAIG